MICLLKKSDTLKPRDVRGKKIKKDHILEIYVFMITLMLITNVLLNAVNFENFSKFYTDTYTMAISCFVALSPLLVLGLLQKFIFGKVICILASDRFYFFKADIVTEKTTHRTNGYVDYTDIKEVEFQSERTGKHTKNLITLHCDGFSIEIKETKKSLKKKIDNAIERFNTNGNTTGEDSLINEFEEYRTPEYNNLFSEIIQEYESGKLEQVISEDAEVFESKYDIDCGLIIIEFGKNGFVMSIDIDECFLTMVYDNGNTYDVKMSDIGSIDEFYKELKNFIFEATEEK